MMKSWELDYWYMDKCVSKKDRIYLNNYINKNYHHKEDASLGSVNTKTGEKKKFADTKVVYLKQIRDKIDNILTNFIGIAQYQFGYNVFQPANNDVVNYNTYSSKNKGRYGYHVDSSQSDICDIKLTLLINISMKPYEGGEFKYFNNQEYEIPYLNVPGNAIVLKSHLNHQVLPVTKGERNTLTYFIHGPKFR